MTPTYFALASLDGKVTCLCPALKGKQVVITERKAKRSAKQNNRYFALLTVAANEMGYLRAEDLHEDIARKLIPLPEIIPGVPRRERTPKMNTKEFAAYADRVEMFLRIDLGVDLSDWDAETARIEGFA